MPSPSQCVSAAGTCLSPAVRCSVCGHGVVVVGCAGRWEKGGEGCQAWYASAMAVVCYQTPGSSVVEVRCVLPVLQSVVDPSMSFVRRLLLLRRYAV